jgi:hypothetical protein
MPAYYFQAEELGFGVCRGCFLKRLLNQPVLSKLSDFREEHPLVAYKQLTLTASPLKLQK